MYKLKSSSYYLHFAVLCIVIGLSLLPLIVNKGKYFLEVKFIDSPMPIYILLIILELFLIRRDYSMHFDARNLYIRKSWHKEPIIVPYKDINSFEKTNIIINHWLAYRLEINIDGEIKVYNFVPNKKYRDKFMEMWKSTKLFEQPGELP